MLKDVSFECRAGEVTAIIGRTGCGKSSILKLIPRLYDATVGHVYVDDMNVKQYKLNELRDLIGYIPPEECTLFRRRGLQPALWRSGQQ